jgi:TP901-1 family phage major tail protein
MSYGNAAQKGAAILIQKGSGGGVVTLGGIRSKTFTLNSETVDVTTADDSNRYRQLLAATGIKNMAVSGDGVVKDTAAQQQAVTDCLAQTVDTYTLTVPGIGVFVGTFQITQFQIGSATYNGEIPYSISLESGGDITFTAEG